jgi:SAM-dependent methyltransferase
MGDDWSGGNLAEEANDIFARFYDEFNYRYRNTQWTGRLLNWAKSDGLRGDRLLDVACGTGHSAIPMHRRGWKVTGCDISSEMLAIAREKLPEAVRLEQADVRQLPVFGSFDLVWALNDPLNYLLSQEELRAALKGMADNLAPQGTLIFDLNTLETYRTFFSEELEVEVGGRHLVWSGLAPGRSFESGDKAQAKFEVTGEAGTAHVHNSRHFPIEQVFEATSAAGLDCQDLRGVTEPEGNLVVPMDEDEHAKAVYLCRKAAG